MSLCIFMRFSYFLIYTGCYFEHHHYYSFYYCHFSYYEFRSIIINIFFADIFLIIIFPSRDTFSYYIPYFHLPLDFFHLQSLTPLLSVLLHFFPLHLLFLISCSNSLPFLSLLLSFSSPLSSVFFFFFSFFLSYLSFFLLIFFFFSFLSFFSVFSFSFSFFFSTSSSIPLQAKPMVCVALEPLTHQDLPKLEAGLRSLYQVRVRIYNLLVQLAFE